jgi:hypothetical protein
VLAFIFYLLRLSYPVRCLTLSYFLVDLMVLLSTLEAMKKEMETPAVPIVEKDHPSLEATLK